MQILFYQELSFLVKIVGSVAAQSRILMRDFDGLTEVSFGGRAQPHKDHAPNRI